jgi:LPS-assembly protein
MHSPLLIPPVCRGGKIIAGIILLLLMTVHSVAAADVSLSRGPVNIDADSIAYDREKDTFHATGDVVMTFTQGFLMADSVVMNRKTNDALAEGHVMIMSEDDLLEGDKVRFDIETKTGVVYEGKMFLEKNHFYVKGSKIIKKGVATYRIDNATATTCDGDSPDWRLKGSELNVTLEGYGTMKHGRFLVKDTPIFYTPYMIFPAKTKRQSGFLFPHLGYSQKKLGMDIELPFFWAISEDTDATFYQRNMEKRGFKEGVEFRYFVSKDTFGTFYGDYMNDPGPPADSVDAAGRNWQSSQKRWSVYLNHETTFSPSFFLRTDIRKVSDGWYFKDFTSNNYYRENYSTTEAERFKKVPFIGDESLGSLESTVRLVKNWQLYNLTALISDTNNFASLSNDSTLQKYPEITMKAIKRPLFGTLLNVEFDSIYDYYYRTVGQRGHLFDMQPVFSVPLNLSDYLQLTPQLGVKGTYWNRDDSFSGMQSKSGDRTLYTAGATATTEIHRIFEVGGERIEKLRHGIRPEFTYTYVPYVNQDNMPDYAGRISEQNTVTYALTNTFLAKLREKGGGKSYLEFLRFKLAQTFDIKEATRLEIIPGDRKPFSDITMELDVKPLQYFSFSARNNYSVYINDWNQTNYDLSLYDSRGDTATIGYRYTKYSLDGINTATSTTPFSSYRYTQSPLQEINLYLKAAVTKSIDVIHILRRNELDKKTLESTFGLNYRKQCWSVDILFSESQTDRTFTVLFSLFGLGKAGSAATTSR